MPNSVKSAFTQMKTTALTFLLLLLLGVTALARIGETPEECIRRYGEPIQRKANQTLFFRKAEISVICCFRDGKCVQVSYRKTADEARFLSPEIDILKAANGSHWQPQAKSASHYTYWRNDTCEVMYDGRTGLLQFATLEELDRAIKERAASEKNLLEGF